MHLTALYELTASLVLSTDLETNTEAGFLAQLCRPLPATWVSYITARVQSWLLLLLSQLPANAPAKAAEDSPNCGLLLPPCDRPRVLGSWL